jgi:hypothetical protein
MKYVRNLYGVWEWLFDSPKIQGKQSNGEKVKKNALKKMKINH